MKIELSKDDAGRLDDVLLKHRREQYTLVLEPGGVFTTRGAWANDPKLGYTAFSGGLLDATGATVKFAADPERFTNGAIRPDRMLPLMWFGPGTTVRGGTWDCTPPTGWFSAGLRFFGRSAVSGVAVSGGAGSRAAGVESFLLSSEGDAGGSVWRDNHVEADGASPDSYVTGIYAGATVRGPASVVERCSAKMGKFGQAAFSASGTPCSLLDCEGESGKWFYVDTGDCDVTIRNSRGAGAWAAIAVAGAAPARRLVLADQCVFTSPRLVEWNDSTGKSISGAVVVRESRFSGQFGATVSGVPSILLSGIAADSPLDVYVVPGSTTPTIL